MLILSNISKTYESRKGVFVNALKETTLQFSNKGMVFILGKSGSGKTTLLNLIGGLDKPSHGDILIHGHSIGNIPLTFDVYRNEYIGFIFQEFNLLETETVYKNMEFPLLLQKQKNNAQKIKEVLKYVDLEGHENRYPSELSGGQKQRIAIGRALIKQSSILLADEPTGNLDSETAESIMKLLKDISKKQLVIVVTHDREYANTYADRIIEIKDGMVTLDSNPEKINISETSLTFKSLTFPTVYAFKMGFHNLLKKKAKTFINLIISTLSIFLIAFSQILLMYSPEDALAQTLSDNNVERIQLFQNRFDSYVVPSSMELPLNPSIYTRSLGGYDYIQIINGYHIITSAQDVLDLGFMFHDYQEITDESRYVTDYFIDMMLDQLDVSNDGIHFEAYSSIQVDYSDFVGKYIRNSFSSQTVYLIAGIIKTDYLTYMNPNFTLKSVVPEDYFEPKVYFAYQRYNQSSYEAVYITENHLRKIDHSIRLQAERNQTTIKSDKTFIIQGFDVVDIVQSNAQVIALTGDNLTVGQVNVSTNDVYITSDLYNKLFAEQISFSEYLQYDMMTDTYTVLKYPNNIGKPIQLKVFDLESKNLVDKTFTLKGVIMDPFAFGSNNFRIYANTTDIESMVHIDFVNNLTIFKLTGSLSKDKVLLNELRKDNNVAVNHFYSIPIYDNEQFQRNLGTTFLIFGIISGIVTVLVTMNFIHYSIVDQKHEIGILRSLGSRVLDVMKIYLFETFMVSILIFLSTTLILFLLVFYNNFSMSKTSYPNMTYLLVEPISIGVAFLASIVLVNVFTILPISKIGRMKPIDAIRK
ncbi:MAG: ABC transporter ATP-binding protein/permease [Acholeplasma sp.]|jgi:ABC-type lipoprotein export system ATPase subunit/ABC-type antimicrobial peptide transport system permease subunit|nr:ABC transporter ATP-binding protein/permease [Acholeplasma sp.]